ncbi:hypothetical protein ACNF5F_28065, partial [Escherichia coli]|uniref:hypothetical protein n=1 Tax=Escherichia coli TaxID=562 RepID=UPI003BA383B4
WLHNEISGIQLKMQVRHGIALCLIGLVDKNERKKIRKIILDTQTREVFDQFGTYPQNHR